MHLRMTTATKSRPRKSHFWMRWGLQAQWFSEECGMDCGLSLQVPYEAKFFALYGGDDGARTRDLCRDRAAF